jgi:hypothetical protein
MEQYYTLMAEIGKNSVNSQGKQEPRAKERKRQLSLRMGQGKGERGRQYW